ncbi:MAG TPA: hypothetical protein VGD37_37600 [Kofleriaceae bacterium]
MAKKQGAARKVQRSSRAAAPARSSRTSRPAARPLAGPEPGKPAPPPEPAAPHDVLAAPHDVLATRDIARLLRYGERFGGDKIDVRMLPLQLHARSGAIAVCDPAEPATWRVLDRPLDRPLGTGAFRVMLSIARPDDETGAAHERLAAVVIHVGRPPIATWAVAQPRDPARPGETRAAEALPRTPVTSGWLALLDAGDGSPGVIALPPATGLVPVEVPLTDGRRALALPCGNGAFAAYWALDAAGRPICVVVDFDVFSQKAWKARPASHPA